MTIAELFVNLGVKGTEKAQAAMQGVKKGLGAVAEGGLAAKAAVVAVIYGLERMTAASGKQGADLQNFAAATGQSAQALQRWQIVAKDFNVSGEEITGTMRGIQNAMTSMQLGEGAPKGFNIFAQSVGLDESKINDVNYMMKKLQEFAKMGDPAVVKNLVSSMGISDNVFSMLRQYKGDVDSIKGGVMSDAEIKRLNEINKSWANIWFTLNRLGNSLSSTVGFPVVKELLDGVAALDHGFKKLEKIAGKSGVMIAAFTAIGTALWLAFGPIGPIVVALGVALTELSKWTEGNKDNLFTKIGKWAEEKGFTPKAGTKLDISALGGGDPMKGLYAPGAKGFMPAMPAPVAPNLNVGLTFNGPTPEDPQSVAKKTSNAVTEAFRLHQAQVTEN